MSDIEAYSNAHHPIGNLFAPNRLGPSTGSTGTAKQSKLIAGTGREMSKDAVHPTPVLAMVFTDNFFVRCASPDFDGNRAPKMKYLHGRQLQPFWWNPIPASTQKGSSSCVHVGAYAM
jgi:hypothetical protein